MDNISTLIFSSDAIILGVWEGRGYGWGKGLERVNLLRFATFGYFTVPQDFSLLLKIVPVLFFF